MTPQDAFVERLRRYRKRGRISLDEVAAITRIKRELLEAFERNDLSEWPRGLYARSWVRTYASVVGLDPIDTVEEFCRLFPHGDRRTGGTLQDMATIVAHASEYRDEFSHDSERRRTEPLLGNAPRINVLPKPAWYAGVTRPLLGLWSRLAVALKTSSAPKLKRAPRTSS